MEIIRTYHIPCEPDEELLKRSAAPDTGKGWQDLISGRVIVRTRKVKAICPSCAYPMEVIFKGEPEKRIACSYCQEAFVVKNS